MKSKIDILLPTYKPPTGWDAKISDAIRNLRQHFSGQEVEISLYLVNDGSDISYFSEDALNRIREAADGRLHFLTYSPNHGKGYALRHGVSHSSGDYLVYTDTDFPFGWETVVLAIEKLQNGADVIMGQRGVEYVQFLSPMRRFLSKTVRKLNRFLLGLPDELLDAQSGLKGFNAKGREVFLKTTVNTFVFDSEFILMSWNRGLDIQTVPLRLAPGLKMSRMGLKVMLREGLLFLGVFLRNRIFTRARRRPEK